MDDLLDVCRRARIEGFGVLSTSEALGAALVLNRADVLQGMGYSIADALRRIGPAWAELIPEVSEVLASEGAVLPAVSEVAS